MIGQRDQLRNRLPQALQGVFQVGEAALTKGEPREAYFFSGL